MVRWTLLGLGIVIKYNWTQFVIDNHLLFRLNSTHNETINISAKILFIISYIKYKLKTKQIPKYQSINNQFPITIKPLIQNIIQILNPNPNSNLHLLTSKTIESPALPLQSVNNIHGSNSLAASVLGVGDSIANHVLQEDLEDATCLLVDETADTLDSATPGQTPNGRLGNSLDVIPQNLTVPFRSSLSQTLASFSSSWHFLSLSLWFFVFERLFCCFCFWW